MAPSWASGFSVFFSLVYLGVLHQARAWIPLFLSGCVYLVARFTAGRPHGPVCIWTASFCCLLAGQMWGDSSWASFTPLLSILDSHRGLVRWQIVFNLLMLRLISFGMDLHWARCAAAERHPSSSDMEQPQHVPASMTAIVGNATLKERTKTSLPLEAYNAAAFLEFAFYPPLYIAGPTCTFNCFASQKRTRCTISSSQVAVYGARWLLAFLLLEVVTHTLYFNATARFGLPAWRAAALASDRSASKVPTITPQLAGLTGWWVLTFMWLKFTVIWRFFRLISLADGLDVPENITRCFANNYDIEGFWKNWHASFNLWLVRYLYIPLGGTHRRALAVWPIFTFVAVWHDLEWRLLAWAWLSCLLFAPELGVKWLAKQPCMARFRERGIWRHICAAGAALNISGLMAVNLAGFVVGPAGFPQLLQDMKSQPSFVLTAAVVFYCAAHLMFWLRECEAAKGRRFGLADVRKCN